MNKKHTVKLESLSRGEFWYFSGNVLPVLSEKIPEGCIVVLMIPYIHTSSRYLHPSYVGDG